MRGDVEMNVALKKRVSAVRWKLLQRLLQSAKNNTILATLWEQPLLREKKKTNKKTNQTQQPVLFSIKWLGTR